MSNVHAIDHPLIAHDLSIARDRDTPTPMFREAVGRVGVMLAYEATRDLALEDRPLTTPMETMTARQLMPPVTIVPILRAGLGFADAIHRILPGANMGHLGMFRDEKKLTPVGYYQKLPHDVADGPVLLVDPMLATGGSAIAAVRLLKGLGCKDIRFLCLIAAPEGIAKLQAAADDVPIYTAAIDRELNEHGYILPGLGDAGDRIFGTTE